MAIPKVKRKGGKKWYADIRGASRLESHEIVGGILWKKKGRGNVKRSQKPGGGGGPRPCAQEGRVIGFFMRGGGGKGKGERKRVAEGGDIL